MLDYRIQAQKTDDGGEMYLCGIVTLPREDAEGGVYQNEDIDIQGLLSDGYLDVNHLMFEHGVQEAVIGLPVEIRQTKLGTWVKFRLENSQLARDIWDYCIEHPGLLGFSIAGGLRKTLFERGGEWLLGDKHGGSVGICRFPMNPGTFAYASSQAALAATVSELSHQTLLRAMSALVSDFKMGRAKCGFSYNEWYDYFKKTAGLSPLPTAGLANWASGYFHSMAETQNLIEQIRGTIVLDPTEDSELEEAVNGEVVKWLSVHPDDPHFNAEGRFKNLDDTVAHFRYCCKLSPIQVARIMGAIRGNPKRFIAHPPKGWASDTSYESGGEPGAA